MRRIATALFAMLTMWSLTTVAKSQTVGYYPGYPFNPSYYIASGPTITRGAHANTAFYAPSAPTYSVPNYVPGYYPTYGSGLGLEGYYARRGYPFRRWSGSRSVPSPLIVTPY